MELFCPSGFPSGTVVCNIWFQLGIVACVLAPVVIVVWFYGRFPLAQRQANVVRTTGIRTTGVLDRFEILTGAPQGVAGRIPVRLFVRVQASAAPAYMAECLTLVHPLRLQALRVGQSMPVYYDPRRPQRIAVEDLG